ncbi:MAG: hypothetical protein SPK06_03230, partial [Kiritimatiellia bacterium]|nr:hypothetical protein [Kiritimatiellia bacterium]
MRTHLSLLVLLTSATLWSAPVIPLLQEVDVLVLGGTAAAVEAALAAKATGARTLLVAILDADKEGFLRSTTSLV